MHTDYIPNQIYCRYFIHCYINIVFHHSIMFIPKVCSLDEQIDMILSFNTVYALYLSNLITDEIQNKFV